MDVTVGHVQYEDEGRRELKLGHCRHDTDHPMVATIRILNETAAPTLRVNCRIGQAFFGEIDGKSE